MGKKEEVTLKYLVLSKIYYLISWRRPQNQCLSHLHLILPVRNCKNCIKMVIFGCIGHMVIWSYSFASIFFFFLIFSSLSWNNIFFFSYFLQKFIEFIVAVPPNRAAPDFPSNRSRHRNHRRKKTKYNEKNERKNENDDSLSFDPTEVRIMNFRYKSNDIRRVISSF